MGAGATDRMADRFLSFIDRHWRWLVPLCWLGFAAWLLYSRWNNVLAFDLRDTDDNMRMAQVRALLAGQDWYDLRQYKLDWPTGANIHWSRLVDLPLAGLILLGRLFLSAADAERFGIAVAPLIPLLLLMVSLTLVVRRLIAPYAWPLAIAALFFAGATLGMFPPTRIDHHGWQLALLATAMAGIADPRRARGGVTLGIASALSLSIGLETIIYLALGGAAMALFWVVDRDERQRLAAYAVSMAGGTALGFLLFASYANRQMVCDALSQVWLSDALLAGALLLALAWWSPPRWTVRLAAAAAAGAIIAVFHALAWPHCLSRLEGVSPELYDLWLSHVREARPVYRHGWRTAVTIAAIPIGGLFGWGLLAWTARREPERLRRILGVMAPFLAATVLLLWQTRTGPAAQMLAIPGGIFLAYYLVPRTLNSSSSIFRVLGTTAAALVGLGAVVPLVVDRIPREKPSARDRAIGAANRSCPTLKAMRPVAQQPAGIVFTFGDLAPRLITLTPHRSIAGPYHRNGPAIIDTMKAFLGTPEEARAIIKRRRADYVLICPSMSQSTVFAADAPNGFYVQLAKGQVPPWLEPIDLGKDSPLKMWRVKD